LSFVCVADQRDIMLSRAEKRQRSYGPSRAPQSLCCNAAFFAYRSDYTYEMRNPHHESVVWRMQHRLLTRAVAVSLL